MMMLRLFRMATSKKGRIPPPRSKSTLPTRKGKIEARLINTGSSPVYKEPSENRLVAGLRSLSVQDRAGRLTSGGVNRQNISGRHRQLSSNSCRITDFKSDLDVAKFVKFGHAKKIVVCTGAGISTASGIPDFRSPGTGLYDNLQQYSIPYPEAIFDIDYFHHNPRPFFTLAKELYPSGKYLPNYSHYFLRMLYDKGQLLRIYTQNIDGLERLSGIPANKLVEAHGTFATATCTVCEQKYEGDDIKEAIFADRVPKCKRRACPGVVKPDIVFFGEDLPRRFYLYLKDILQADLIVVMGTSLEVQPFAGIIDLVRYNVPRILFNMTAVGPFRHRKRAHDFAVTGDLIESIQTFVCRLGWKHELEELISNCEGQKEAWTSSEDGPSASTDSGAIKNGSSNSAVEGGELPEGRQPAPPHENSDLNQPKRHLHTISSAKSDSSRPLVANKHRQTHGAVGTRSSTRAKLPYGSQQCTSQTSSYRNTVVISSSSSEDTDSDESSSDDSR